MSTPAKATLVVVAVAAFLLGVYVGTRRSESGVAAPGPATAVPSGGEPKLAELLGNDLKDGIRAVQGTQPDTAQYVDRVIDLIDLRLNYRRICHPRTCHEQHLENPYYAIDSELRDRAVLAKQGNGGVGLSKLRVHREGDSGPFQVLDESAAPRGKSLDEYLKGLTTLNLAK